MREFSYQLSREGQEVGHLTVTVFVQATKEDAALTLALIQDQGYEACQAPRGVDDLGRSSRSAATLQGAAGLPLPPELKGHATRSRVAYSYRGSPKTSIQDNYDVVVGRVHLRLGFETCCTGFAEAEEAGIVSRTAARFATSPLGA